MKKQNVITVSYSWNDKNGIETYKMRSDDDLDTIVKNNLSDSSEWFWSYVGCDLITERGCKILFSDKTVRKGTTYYWFSYGRAENYLPESEIIKKYNTDKNGMKKDYSFGYNYKTKKDSEKVLKIIKNSYPEYEWSVRKDGDTYYIGMLVNSDDEKLMEMMYEEERNLELNFDGQIILKDGKDTFYIHPYTNSDWYVLSDDDRLYSYSPVADRFLHEFENKMMVDSMMNDIYGDIRSEHDELFPWGDEDKDRLSIDDEEIKFICKNVKKYVKEMTKTKNWKRIEKSEKVKEKGNIGALKAVELTEEIFDNPKNLRKYYGKKVWNTWKGYMDEYPSLTTGTIEIDGKVWKYETGTTSSQEEDRWGNKETVHTPYINVKTGKEKHQFHFSFDPDDYVSYREK